MRFFNRRNAQRELSPRDQLEAEILEAVDSVTQWMKKSSRSLRSLRGEDTETRATLTEITNTLSDAHRDLMVLASWVGGHQVREDTHRVAPGSLPRVNLRRADTMGAYVDPRWFPHISNASYLATGVMVQKFALRSLLVMQRNGRRPLAVPVSLARMLQGPSPSPHRRAQPPEQTSDQEQQPDTVQVDATTDELPVSEQRVRIKPMGSDGESIEALAEGDYSLARLLKADGDFSRLPPLDREEVLKRRRAKSTGFFEGLEDDTTQPIQRERSGVDLALPAAEPAQERVQGSRDLL